MTDTMDMLNELPEFFVQLKSKLTLQEERIKQLEEQVEANDRIEERMIAIQTKERLKFEEEKMKWEQIEKIRETMISDSNIVVDKLKKIIDEKVEENDRIEERMIVKWEEEKMKLQKIIDGHDETIESQKEEIEKLNKKLEKKKYNKQYQDEHKEKVAKKKKEKAPKKKSYLQKAELLECPCLANQKKTTFRRDGKSGHFKSITHQEWYLANPDWVEPESWKPENSKFHTKTDEEIDVLYEIEKSKSPRRSVSTPTP